MSREQILSLLRQSRAELETRHVQSLALFGSFARGEERPDSDVDLLVEFSRPVGLFHIIRVKHRLEEILGRPVDLVLKNGLKPRLRERVLGEAIDAA